MRGILFLWLCGHQSKMLAQRWSGDKKNVKLHEHCGKGGLLFAVFEIFESAIKRIFWNIFIKRAISPSDDFLRLQRA
jgi:hypothetical protein